MIDTVELAGDSGDDLAGWQLPGPASRLRSEAQWAWIDATLAASAASYLIVAGHYPILSVCEHGPTTQLIDRLAPLMAAANASAYLAGHDHCAEYLEQYGFAHHGVGAAHLYDASTAHAAAVPSASLKWHYLPGDASSTKDDASRGAFAAATWDGASLRVVHYDQDGAEIFAAPPVPPRGS